MVLRDMCVCVKFQKDWLISRTCDTQMIQRGDLVLGGVL